MPFDRAAIMTAAHEIARRFPREPYRKALARGLGCAWWNAKEAAKVEARMAARRTLEAAEAARSPEDLRAEIEALHNKSFLGHEGLERVNRLRRALTAAEAREAQRIDAARTLIAAARGRFCTVTFAKKDGTERVMRIQPAALKFHVKGEDASDAGRKAAVTRTLNHPNFLPVWDADAKAVRSVNLATVSRIAAGGRVHTFPT